MGRPGQQYLKQVARNRAADSYTAMKRMACNKPRWKAANQSQYTHQSTGFKIRDPTIEYLLTPIMLTLQRGATGTARMLHALTHSSISRQVREQM